MDRIINELRNKGMHFEKNDDEKSAEKYLNYNTCWQLLKRSRNLLILNSQKEKRYEGTSFFQIRTAGLVHLYFNLAFEPLIKEFEHGLKVYMSSMYEKANDEEKNEIFVRWSHINFKFKNDNILEENNIFKIYEYATLSELLECYKSMKQKINSFKLVEIDYKVSIIRNKLYHHDNILIEDKVKDNNQIDKKN